MSEKYSIVLLVLVWSAMAVGLEDSKAQYVLKEEFDISSLWHEGMTWEEFLEIRNGLRRESLIKYVDKIEQQKMAQEAGLEVPKTYIATRDKVPLVELLSGLQSYVAKVTHMSLSQGLVLVKDGMNQLSNQPANPEEIQEHLFQSLNKRPRKVESWSLHHVQPGFMVQEYIPNRNEVKIQTIWGRAVIGEWRAGDGSTSTTPVWGRYARDGRRVNGQSRCPAWWSKAVLAAEHMGQGTDALRVDFLVREDGTLLLNELEIWPESTWDSMKDELEKQLNDGYRLHVSNTLGSVDFLKA